jgi:hypothetical protein
VNESGPRIEEPSRVLDAEPVFWWLRAYRLVVRTLGDGEQSRSRSVLGGRTVVWSAICGSPVGCGGNVVAPGVARPGSRRARKGSTGLGRSVARLRCHAVSMPDLSRRWQHGRGPERLLPRRTPTQRSNHTRHECRRSFGARNASGIRCASPRYRPLTVRPRFEVVSRQQGSAAVGSARPDPRRRRRGRSFDRCRRSRALALGTMVAEAPGR